MSAIHDCTKMNVLHAGGSTCKTVSCRQIADSWLGHTRWDVNMIGNPKSWKTRASPGRGLGKVLYMHLSHQAEVSERSSIRFYLTRQGSRKGPLYDSISPGRGLGKVLYMHPSWAFPAMARFPTNHRSDILCPKRTCPIEYARPPTVD
jgi:hypothetical protein